MNQLNIKPLRDLVVIRPDKEANVTQSGIILEESLKPKKGTVMAVGKGLNGNPVSVIPKDIISFQRNAGTEIEIDGDTFLIMPETDIIMIL